MTFIDYERVLGILILILYPICIFAVIWLFYKFSEVGKENKCPQRNK